MKLIGKIIVPQGIWALGIRAVEDELSFPWNLLQHILWSMGRRLQNLY